MAQSDDVVPLGAIAFGEDCRFRYNVCAGLVHNQAHALQRAAGGDYVVEDGYTFAGDQAAILFVRGRASGVRLW